MNGPARPPAVLQLISSGGVYGAESVALGLAIHLRTRGGVAALGILESPGAQALARRAAAEQVPVTTLPASPGGAWRCLGTVLGNFDIVHSHGYKTDVLAALPLLGCRAQRVATCHAWLSDSIKLRLYECLDRLSLHRFQQVVAVSPQVLGKLRRSGIRRGRRSLVENGVDVPAVNAAARAQARTEFCRGGEHLIVRVGRLDRFKGNNHLLQAFALLPTSPSARLLFVGDGEQRSELSSLANKLGVLGRVGFIGYRADVVRILAAADVMAISSTSEGLPLVLLEAMALGVPIVSTSVGGIPQVVQGGRSAWLVPPGDPAALAGAIAAALADPDEARQRAQAASQEYKAGYSREAMGLRYEAVYARALQNAAPGRR